jgi:hypothetical protein
LFVRQLQEQYEQVYGALEPGYPGVIEFIARLAMENIANSDAPYHDMNHTIMVALVGQEVLRGKHISEGGVTPRDWLHFIISLLCHDIGYVRGVCRGDGDGRYVCKPREQFDMKIAENPEPSAQLEAILAQLERSTIGNAASLIVKGIRFQKAEESRSPAPYSD